MKVFRSRDRGCVLDLHPVLDPVRRHARTMSANKERRKRPTCCKGVFGYPKDQDFIDSVIARLQTVGANTKRTKRPSLQIRDVRSLYHTSPEKSGVTITTIGRSANSVIELHGDIVGTCKDVFEFVRSSAFTKVYENLLAQVYKRVPALADLDFNTVSSKYSKAVILKYITNKRTFQPNHHVLDNPEEKNVMTEILIEMENSALLGQQNENPGYQRNGQSRTRQGKARRIELDHQKVYPGDLAALQPAVREGESRT
ncbi:MAG: hypothetical protein ACLTZY_14415 [Alistipes indistinctus]